MCDRACFRSVLTYVATIETGFMVFHHLEYRARPRLYRARDSPRSQQSRGHQREGTRGTKPKQAYPGSCPQSCTTRTGRTAQVHGPATMSSTSEDKSLLATAAPPRRLKSIAAAALLSFGLGAVVCSGQRRGSPGQVIDLRDDARRRRDEGVRAMPRVPGPAALQVDPVQGHRGPVRRLRQCVAVYPLRRQGQQARRQRLQAVLEVGGATPPLCI